MNTTWEQRRHIEQQIAEGVDPSAEDMAALLEDADHAEVCEETLDALEQALQSVGYKLEDVTTDESEHTELQLVEVQ